MKKNKPNHQILAESPTRRIRIEFTHPTSETVHVAASFNDWRPETTPMIPLSPGRWVKDLVLPPGTYEYCLVVDGVYLPDPRARETVPNPFGGMNSVLRVAVPAGTKCYQAPPAHKANVNEHEQENSNCR